MKNLFTLSAAFASALVVTASPANAQMIDYACVYGGFCPYRPSAPPAPNPAPQASVDHNFRGLYINLDANNYMTGRVLYTGSRTSNVVGNVDLIDSSGRVMSVVRVILTPSTLSDGQTADYAIQLPTWVSRVHLRNFNHNPF